MNIISTNKNPYIFTKNQFFCCNLNGKPRILVVLAGNYTASCLAEELNDQLCCEDNLNFYAKDDYLALQTPEEFEFLSVQDDIYGVVGWDGLEPAVMELEVADYIEVVVGGSRNVSVDGVKQLVCLNQEINILGCEARKEGNKLVLQTKHRGSDASLMVGRNFAKGKGKIYS